jgi:hypothetical protein
MQEVFELVQVSVDGRQVPARRTTRVGSQTYTVTPGGTKSSSANEIVDLQHEVTVAYTFRVLVQKHGHLIHIDLARPTKGFNAQFSYGNCGIRHVNVVDYVASARRSRITRLPASGPTPSVEVAFDGWIMPKAGVGFVWVLDDELPPARGRPSSRHPVSTE